MQPIYPVRSSNGTGRGQGGRVIPCKAQAAASEIGGIGESDFDVIVMSSVVRYFPNTLYLEEVIRSAIGLLKEEGILYLDDLLDHRKKGNWQSRRRPTKRPTRVFGQNKLG
ncbi:hypothetical protein P7H16_12985 [Paenibacillus larvae]|nr:hypothetical protein [Paenibacillus larvae]MDT2247647.1 hypothetical protein [Paenibacillus larvae]